MATNDAARLTKLILLIDGENIPSKYAGAILAKTSELGTVVEGRVYGAPDSSKMRGWQQSTDAVSLKKIFVKRMSKRKDVADFKLTVEAMDMLYTRQLDGFCICSSDGDFSALAASIAARTVSLYGFGDLKKAPQRYRDICSDFFDCDEMVARSKLLAKKEPAERPHRSKPARSGRHAAAPDTPVRPSMKQSRERITKLPIPGAQIRAAIQVVKADSGGWAQYRSVEKSVVKAIPGFSPKNYGFESLEEILNEVDGVKTKPASDGNILVRLTAAA